MHLYPPDLRSESVLPRERERESSARGGRRRETHIRESERFNSHMHVMSYECCTGFLITTDLQPNGSLSRWQSERHANCAVCTTDAAKGKVSDNRFLNLSISNYCIRMIWHKVSIRTHTETENENSTGYSHQVKVDDLFCKQ